DAAGALTTIGEGLGAFVIDPRRQQLAVLAYVNSLGVLAIIPVLWWRQTAELLAERYEWAAYVAANVVLSVAGGADGDRFAVSLAALALRAVTAIRRSSPPSRRWLYLVLVQATAMELFLPWFPE